jgi:hypothetical protein
LKMTERIIRICSLTGLMLFLSLAPVSALMIGISTEELTRSAELVVSGKVESIESSWTADGKSIVTRATVAINETVKGQPRTERVVVEYEGGEVGGVGLKVSDISPLIKGSDVILFLKSGVSRASLSGQGLDQKTYHFVGKSQGKYTIGEDGIARKSGFSLMGGEGAVDNNISRQELIDKVRSAK